MSYLPHVTFKDTKERLTIYTKAGRDFVYFILLRARLQAEPGAKGPVTTDSCFVLGKIAFCIVLYINMLISVFAMTSMLLSISDYTKPYWHGH